MEVENTIWKEFKTFLYNSINDLTNRALDAANKYERAYQRRNQSVGDFVIYMDELELELGIENDSERCCTLYGKLRPDIKVKILIYYQVSETREDLIALAKRIEGAERMARGFYKEATTGGGDYPGNPPNPGREKVEAKQADSQKDRGKQCHNSSSIPSRVNRTPLGTKPGESSTDCECFCCKQKGHLSLLCPNIECYNCRKKGYISISCPKPRRTGNDPARS